MKSLKQLQKGKKNKILKKEMSLQADVKYLDVDSLNSPKNFKGVKLPPKKFFQGGGLNKSKLRLFFIKYQNYLEIFRDGPPRLMGPISWLGWHIPPLTEILYPYPPSF